MAQKQPLTRDQIDRNGVTVLGTVQSRAALLIVDPSTEIVTGASRGFLEREGAKIGTHLSELFTPDGLATVRDIVSARTAPLRLRPVTVKTASGRLCEVLALKTASAKLLLELWPCDTPRIPTEDQRLADLLLSLGDLSTASDFGALCDQATQILAALTDFEHVLLYRFTDSGDGRVVAETLNAESGPPNLSGQRIPASDLMLANPSMFLNLPARVVCDFESPGDHVVSETGLTDLPDLSAVLTYEPDAALVEIAHRLGIRTLLDIALYVNGDVWGAVSLRSARPTRLSLKFLAAVVVFAGCVGDGLAKLKSNAASTMRRRLAEITSSIDQALNDGETIGTAIHSALPNVTALFGGESAIFSVNGTQWTETGPVSDPLIRLRPDEAPMIVDRFDGLVDIPAPLTAQFYGGVLIPLSPSADRDFLLIGRSANRRLGQQAGPRRVSDLSLPDKVSAVSPARKGACTYTQPFSVVDDEAASSLRVMLTQRLAEACTREAATDAAGGQGAFPPWRDSSMDWFWKTDASGRLMSVTRFFDDDDGTSSVSVAGLRLVDLFVTGTRGSDRSDAGELQAAFDQRVAFHGLTALLQLPGYDQCWVRLSGFPILADDGVLRGFRGAATNVSHSRALQEKNISSQRLEALGRMASGIAHEINNVLQPMLTMSYYASKRLDDQAFVRQALSDIEESGLRAREIMKAILAFGRQTPSERHALRIAPELSKAIDFAQRGLPRLKIDRDIEDTDLKVLANTTELSQIVLNLLTNAADAMNGRGTVTVTLRTQPESQRVLISVRDEGGGMDLTTRSRIFDPFFTTKVEGKGTGLGLAIVHGLVEAWGGTVGVESMPGIGTTFRISLPTFNAD